MGPSSHILDEGAHVVYNIPHNPAQGLRCDRIGLMYSEHKIPKQSIFLALFIVLLKGPM